MSRTNGLVAGSQATTGAGPEKGEAPDRGDRPAAADGLSEAAAPFRAVERAAVDAAAIRVMPTTLSATDAAPTTPAPTTPSSTPTPSDASPPIVAIGASAGGLDAVEQFFAAVETPSRFAFVVIQALSPDFQNLMVELLAKRTSLAVRPVEDGMAPEPGAIHLIPPGSTMTIEAGRLRLADRDEDDLARNPIDAFFVSLAADRGAAAIGIVLSGSGSDGSRGARAIRSAGGRLLVQQPKTAKFSAMPQNAIDPDGAAEIMAPDALARALLATPPRPTGESDPQATGALPPALAGCLDQAFGIDCSTYRSSTLQHGVHRRMMLKGFDRLDAYTAFVADDPDEREALYQDLLIGPTGFCRDAAAFATLEREVAPSLAAGLDQGEEVRLWVPACATGEEAYSLAMLVIAQCRAPLENLPLRVFATDVHRRSLAIAGAGLYSEEAVEGVRPEWRERFFAKRSSGWQVDQAVRRVITFSPHDLLRDPPFTRIQLISCRNLLAHLEPDAGDGVLTGFAACLLPGGHLLLGADETAVRHADRFVPLQADLPLYRKKCHGPASGESRRMVGPNQTLPGPPLPGSAPPGPPPPGPPLTVGQGHLPARERRDQRLTMAHEMLLDRYVPPSLLVDEAGQVIHSFGDAGPYLKPPGGRPSLAVLDMVEDLLRAPLASAISRVKRTGRPTTLTRLALARGPDAPFLPRLVVETPTGRQDSQRCLLVSFDDRQLRDDSPSGDSSASRSAGDSREGEPSSHLDGTTQASLEALDRDRRFSEEVLADNITTLEARHRELATANEEVWASHRALCSAGIEHQRRIEILLGLGRELECLVEATGLAALLLGPDFGVRRYTPAAARYVDLLPRDIGRPLAHVTHQFGDTDIMALLRAATGDGKPCEHDLRTSDGNPVRLTITPLLGLDRAVTGIAVGIQDRALPEPAASA